MEALLRPQGSLPSLPKVNFYNSSNKLSLRLNKTPIKIPPTHFTTLPAPPLTRFHTPTLLQPKPKTHFQIRASAVANASQEPAVPAKLLGVEVATLKKVVPLGLMFFCILFNYTILRDTKDVLVVTAKGSSAEIIPFLKTWVNLPTAIGFMIVYNKLSNVLSKEQLFYACMLPFIAFFGAFAFVLYPNVSLIHPTAFADRLLGILGPNFLGPIAILRIWSFCIFYVMAELWGSVVVSLLFWGYANQITTVDEASQFYPLFGLGANVALVFSGRTVKFFSNMRKNLGPGVDGWAVSLKGMMSIVVGLGLVICGIYWGMNRVIKPEVGRKQKKKEKTKMGTMESLKFLISSRYIRDLATLVVAYGISINLVEVTWKSKLKAQFPSPNEYSAFMGDFSSLTGVATFSMMLLSRVIFRKFGWGVAAAITPSVLLVTGVAFFSLVLFSDPLAPVFGSLGVTPLLAAVYVGALQNIFSKSAKYSLFDPCKEMAYIPLDEDTKLKGKAAIDVVCNPLGKSGGALIQQFLILTFGSLANSTPYLGGILLIIVLAWLAAARSLDSQFTPMAKKDLKDKLIEGKISAVSSRLTGKHQQKQGITYRFAKQYSMAMHLELLLLLLLLSWLTVASVAGVNESQTKPGCQQKCGTIIVPYPFGIGEKCSIAPWANITCNATFNPPKPFIGDIEVIEFSPTEVRIKTNIASTCHNQTGRSIAFLPAPYTFSSTKNKFTAIGCNTFGTANLNSTYSVGCTSFCERKEDAIEGSCSGIGCCQSSIPKGQNIFLATVETIYNYTRVSSIDLCGSAFLAEQDRYSFRISDFTTDTHLRDIPIVLDFAVASQTCRRAKKDPATFACRGDSSCHDTVDGGGYFCNCSDGYKGNPYLDQGCLDVDECADPNRNPCKGMCINTDGSFECSCPSDSYGDGTKNGNGCTKKNKEIPVLQLTLGFGLGSLFLLATGSWLYMIVKKRRLFKLKEKFFQQNGGLLLKQQLSSNEGSESTKIFTSEDLKVATDNYAEHMILGQGGYGTVYKGVLHNLKVVAIKKSKIFDANQLGQFINEVVILMQINHRNVVKLLGCCLETEVPLLVYEFVSNGTLFQHLHKKNGTMSSLSWEDRLRIAAETAGALSYLHSAASTPIIHRDVKSANILLDDNYTAKVADFGASKLNPLDETQISTLVQGTMGYLDPEYFHSGQLTDKSDVYSFGVLLAELLTGEKPICFERSQEQRSLATYFIVSMKENRVFELLETEIVNDGHAQKVHAVAQLAKRCLSVTSEPRPSMKEVAAELEGLRGFQKHAWVKTPNGKTGSLASEHEMDSYAISSISYSTAGATSYYSLENDLEQWMDDEYSQVIV